MPLLATSGLKFRLPTLEGNEVLVGPDPEICKVKGVMFGARKQFLLNEFGEQAFYDVLARLSLKALALARTPLAGNWYDFANLVEYDRAIHDFGHAKHPEILVLLGAASAEFAMGRVYRALDDTVLTKSLENVAAFHQQYQKYGRVQFKKTDRGGLMMYFDYPCYSPVFCASAIGFFLEAILRHGGTSPGVEETRCHCRGDGVCVYDLEWR
jgi:hypothetical protein